MTSTNDSYDISLIEKFRNFFSIEQNLTSVESVLTKLNCRASDLKEEVTIGEKTGSRKRKCEVENWFGEVERLEKEFDELKCRIQDLPWWKNLLIGDSLVKIGEDVKKLMDQTTYFDGRLCLDVHENRGELPLVPEHLSLCVPKPLFGQILDSGRKRICDWLINDELFNIGIYGMRGVGKTTLAKCIHNHLLEETNFKIFWVTVCEPFDVKKLQDDIAKRLPLDLSGEDDENRRAAMLSRAIANDSLLILDGVVENFSLEAMGIVVGPNKCRLIFTTQSLPVCDRMLCKEKFQVTALGKEDSLDLFKHTLGDNITLSAKVESIANSVANLCAGLPRRIITTATDMRGITDILKWEDLLAKLKSSSDGHHEMEDKVFSESGWWPTHYKIDIVSVRPNESSANNDPSFIEIYDVVDCKRRVRLENEIEFKRCNFQKGLDVVLASDNLHRLDLYQCSGLSDCFFHSWINRSKDLYHLCLSGFSEFVLNLSSPDYDEGVSSNLESPLLNLRVIELRCMPNLVGLIYVGRWSLIPPGTFSSLKELRIVDCHGLKELFSVQLAQQCLQNLEHLIVRRCDRVEEIIPNNDLRRGGGKAPSSSGPSTSTSQELLPKLQKLILDRLPKLENVCSLAIGGDQSTIFKLRDCPKLKRLPSFSSTEITYKIYGREEWWNSLEWNNPSDKEALQPFLKVINRSWMFLRPSPGGDKYVSACDRALRDVPAFVQLDINRKNGRWSFQD